MPMSNIWNDAAMRIVDAHAHVFERASGRKGDLPVSSGRYGRVTIGGREERMLPPCFADSACPAELLVEMMDSAGVEKAVLLQNPVFGSVNDYVRASVERWPDRLTGTVQVDPAREDACSEIERYASARQHVLKLEMSEEWGWSGRYAGLSLTDERFVKIWDTAARLGLQVIVDPGPVFNAGYQVREIAAVASAYPTLRLLIEHLGYMTAGQLADEKAWARWREMLCLGRTFENVWFGVSAVWSLLEERYPCPASQRLLEEAAVMISPDKLIWGSDLPTTLRGLTYRQMIDFVAVECRFLPKLAQEKILGRNAELFFGL